MSDEVSQNILSSKYSPAEVEQRIYKFWESGGYFKSQDVSTKPPFCIMLPPPNVTGSLHLGHALDHTIQDTLIRWKRMSGFNACWVPGTDHAGIATQMVVEKNLAKEGSHRKEMGREKFLEKVWEWKNQYGNRILEQMRRLGDSCDWDRLRFTMDDGLSQAVRKVFVDLYKQGHIYRGTRLVNWDTHLESAVSDLEVEHQERKGSIWKIKYPIEGTQDYLIVATTRPETLFGDTAVAVHPSDDRYKSFIGKSVLLPLTSKKIPIVSDEYVDKEFGSGVVKITPGHDFNDYEVGQRHKLPIVNILTTNGLLNENAGAYKGLKTQEARKRVLADLEAQGLLASEEAYTQTVPISQRTGVVIEPFISKQWFMSIKKVAAPAKAVVETGTTQFIPEQWTKTYLHWMSNIEDWCVSRQLWWGHRIPAWYCSDCQHVTVSEADPIKCEKCSSTKISQDDDVLDTWFSSALWPFSTLGWPAKTEALKTFYPTDVLVTGHDIIFFWVARMMMQGLHFMGDVPFRTVYIHGLIRDAQGKKMSKSVGNALDPLELIDEYGADALRFTLMALIAGGRDLKFSEQRLEGYRNFMNKIWNATRFALQGLDGFAPKDGLPNKADLSVYDQWITFRLKEVEAKVQEAFEDFRFSDAVNVLYGFVWNDFCDWYLEFIKPIIYGDKQDDKAATQHVLAVTLNRIVRLLHPIAPFITEEIYSKLPIHGDACIVDEYPTVQNDKEWLSIGGSQAAHETELVKEVVAAIRNIRGENRIKPGVKIKAQLSVQDGKVQKMLGNNKAAIMRMGGVDDCSIDEVKNFAKCAVAPIQVGSDRVDIVIPLEGLVDFEEEIQRIEKTVEKNMKELSGLRGRLENENFIKNAPEEVVVADRERMAQLDVQIKSLRESLERLRS